MHYSDIHYQKLVPVENNRMGELPHIIWGHGWGSNHHSFLAIATSLYKFGIHWLLDLPGFGLSPQPDSIWGIKEYTEIINNWIKANIPSNATKIWIGHSFGCRIGINLAALEPNLLQGLVLIAAAGIPRTDNLLKKAQVTGKIWFFKLCKNILLLFKQIDYIEKLKHKFGSADYKNADPIMQKILVKIINENLAIQAQQVICPTELIYGMQDTETPVKLGNTLHKLIAHSKLHIIPDKDHWNILALDLYPVVYLLKNFINNYYSRCALT